MIEIVGARVWMCTPRPTSLEGSWQAGCIHNAFTWAGITTHLICTYGRTPKWIMNGNEAICLYNVAIFISLDIFGIVGQRIIEGVVMVFCENIAGAGAVMECKCFVIKLDTPFAHTVMTIYSGSPTRRSGMAHSCGARGFTCLTQECVNTLRCSWRAMWDRYRLTRL